MMLTPKEKQRSPSQAAQVVSQVVHNCKRKLRKWQRQSFLKRNKVSKVVVHEEHTVHYYCPQFPVTHRYGNLPIKEFTPRFDSFKPPEQAESSTHDGNTDDACVSPEVPTSRRTLPDIPDSTKSPSPHDRSKCTVPDPEDGARRMDLLLENLNTPDLIVQRGVPLVSSFEAPTSPQLPERISKTVQSPAFSRNDQDVVRWYDAVEGLRSPLSTLPCHCH
jgi:hypothetical protein